MSDAADVVEALAAGFTSAVPDGVTVIDGPPWDPPTDDFLCVGHGGDIEQAGVLVTTPMDAYDGDQAENVEVLNYLTVFLDEDGSVTSTRRRAVDIFKACRSWLAANQFLGDLVADARVNPGYTLSVVQFDVGGVAVALQFTVSITGS